MKQIILRFLIFLPILLFTDWIIMVVVGCTSNFCNANAAFFNTFYSYFGTVLVILSFLSLFFIMFRQRIHQV